MGAYLRQFNGSLQTPGQPSGGAQGTSSPSSNSQGQTGAGPQPTGPGNTQAQARDTWSQQFIDDYGGLALDPSDPAPWIRNPEGKNAVPKPEVEYSFCFKVVNTGIDHSGPFFIRFKLTGGEDWHRDYLMGNGLKAGGSVMACVPYGIFPLNASYELMAHVYATDHPPPEEPVLSSFLLMFNVQDNNPG